LPSSDNNPQLIPNCGKLYNKTRNRKNKKSTVPSVLTKPCFHDIILNRSLEEKKKSQGNMIFQNKKNKLKKEKQ